MLVVAENFFLVILTAIVTTVLVGILFRGFEFWSLRLTPLTLRERALKDEIEKLARLLDEARSKIDQLEQLVQYLLQELQIRGSNEADVNGTESIDARRSVLVAVGPDRMLDVDLAAFRAVATRTNLRFQRLRDVTKNRFERFLERHRSSGRPIRYVHLATHAGPDGVEFADGRVDGVWLSERLGGVEVLLLDGCEASNVGDLLGVVPYVVTMNEPIDNHDAMLFAEAFWCEIGNGKPAEVAFYLALDRSPPVISEFAELHV